MKAADVFPNNTKTATSFIFSELHVVDLNIDRYDMIIGHDSIRYLGIDIQDTNMTIHWDNAASHGATYIPAQTMYLRYCNKMHRSTQKPSE